MNSTACGEIAELKCNGSCAQLRKMCVARRCVYMYACRYWKVYVCAAFLFSILLVLEFVWSNPHKVVRGPVDPLGPP